MIPRATSSIAIPIFSPILIESNIKIKTVLIKHFAASGKQLLKNYINVCG